MKSIKNHEKKFNIEWKDPGKLTPYFRNTKAHPTSQVDKIAGSIAEFDWTQPIVADEKGVIIIIGHGRREAALQMSLDLVPVLTVKGWSEAKKKAARLADNKLNESEWLTDELAQELESLKADGFDLALTGFDLPEIDGILAEMQGEYQGLTDEDDIPETVEPVCKPGQLWQLGEHRLLCGDSTDPETHKKLFDGATAILMVTDPPYGVEYDPSWRAKAGINKNKSKMGIVKNDNLFDWTAVYKLFTGEVAYVWHAGKYTGEISANLVTAGFEMVSQIIWVKDRFALSRGDYHWQHEPCWYAVKKGKKHHFIGDRKNSTTWNIKRADDSGHGHGTQKPVECMARPIRNHSSDIVFDPFLGSGTTVIACEKLGRKCYGIELDPGYCDIIINRWQDFTGKKASIIDS